MKLKLLTVCSGVAVAATSIATQAKVPGKENTGVKYQQRILYIRLSDQKWKKLLATGQKLSKVSSS